MSILQILEIALPLLFIAGSGIYILLRKNKNTPVPVVDVPPQPNRPVPPSVRKDPSQP